MVKNDIITIIDSKGDSKAFMPAPLPPGHITILQRMNNEGHIHSKPTLNF